MPIADVDVRAPRPLIVQGNLGCFPNMIVFVGIATMDCGRTRTYAGSYDDVDIVGPISDENSPGFIREKTVCLTVQRLEYPRRDPYGYVLQVHFGCRLKLSTRQEGIFTPSRSSKLNV